MKKITDEIITEYLRQKPDGSLFHREQKDLEFKESFNLAGLAEYFRDFAGFANNSGGYIIFGVTNSPRKLKGLSDKSLGQFNGVDEERISGYFNEHFAPYIDCEMGTIKIGSKSFGIFYAFPSIIKPVICKKGDDRQIIKSGEVYYRYAGRTEVIQYSELSSIIENRVSENNKEWIRKVKKIGEVGPANVGILDTTSGVIEGSHQTLLIDQDIIKDINFIKEGQFKEKMGARTLKLVGSVQSVGKVEVAKVVKKRLIDEYPYSYRKLEAILKSKNSIKPKEVHKIIKENDLKNDKKYSVYNFTNKDRQDDYEENGIVGGAPSIFNDAAIEFIIKVLSNEKGNESK